MIDANTIDKKCEDCMELAANGRNNIDMMVKLFGGTDVFDDVIRDFFSEKNNSPERRKFVEFLQSSNTGDMLYMAMKKNDRISALCSTCTENDAKGVLSESPLLQPLPQEEVDRQTKSMEKGGFAKITAAYGTIREKERKSAAKAMHKRISLMARFRLWLCNLLLRPLKVRLFFN